MSQLMIGYEERANDRAFCKLCQKKIHKGSPTIWFANYHTSTAYVHKSCVEKIADERERALEESHTKGG